MPIDNTFVKGRGVGLYISDPAPAGKKATRPTPVTFTVKTAASKGATSIDIAADEEVMLYPNQILVFNEDSSDEVVLVVTEKVLVTTSSTSVNVDIAEGEEGAGIPDALGENDEAEWNRMYRVLGTSNAGFNIGESNTELTSTTYDTANAISWREADATSKSFDIPRQGRFKPHDPAFRAIVKAALNDLELWAERVSPDEEGERIMSESGRAKVNSYSPDSPADGIYDVSYTLAGQGKPDIKFLDEQ